MNNGYQLALIAQNTESMLLNDADFMPGSGISNQFDNAKRSAWQLIGLNVMKYIQKYSSEKQYHENPGFFAVPIKSKQALRNAEGLFVLPSFHHVSAQSEGVQPSCGVCKGKRRCCRCKIHLQQRRETVYQITLLRSRNISFSAQPQATS